VTSSWFFLSTLNYDARSTTYQKEILFPFQLKLANGRTTNSVYA